MNIIELQWDDDNIEHIAKHHVNPKEVEDVCFGSYISQRESVQRYILSGCSNEGRYLNIVIEKIGKGIFRPITAFEMSEQYKRRFKERLGR